MTATPPSLFITTTPPPDYTLALQTEAGQLDGSGHEQLAAIYALRGNRRASLAHDAAAMSTVADSSQDRQLVADALFAQRDWLLAQDVLEGLLDSDPTNPTANYQLGLLLVVHNPRQAYAHLTRAGGDPELALAAETLQTAIVTSATDAPAVQYLQIGMALAALEQWSLAEQSFALTMAFEPAYAEAWAYLGLARAQQNKATEGVLERALLLGPDSATVLLLVGLAEQVQGDYEAALQLMTQAQALDPQNPAIAAEIGNVYRLSGDYVAAEQWFQAAAGLTSADPEFMTLLAMFYVESGYDLSGDGFAFLQEVAAGQPENAELQAVYAWGLLSQGDAEAAQETIAQARFLAPANPRILYYQGLIYQATNQYDLAVATLLEVLHHPAPEGFDMLARRVLERLR